MGRPSAAPVCRVDLGHSGLEEDSCNRSCAKVKGSRETGIDRQAGRRLVLFPAGEFGDRRWTFLHLPAAFPSDPADGGCWTSGQQPVGSPWAAKPNPRSLIEFVAVVRYRKKGAEGEAARSIPIIIFVNHSNSVTAKLRQLQPMSGLANAICIEICERHGYNSLFEQVPTSVHAANRQVFQMPVSSGTRDQDGGAMIGALITILPNGIRNPPLCAKGDTRSSTDGMGYNTLGQVTKVEPLSICEGCTGKCDAKSAFLDQRKWGKRGKKIERRVDHGIARGGEDCVAVIALQQFMCPGGSLSVTEQ
ncbi:hypothetical protein An15g05430 [Aspergillus niger]|uniref:Uncharacterized protein n=2 Tax=Aspergillus niger TaxID=5061 RepID=A2R5S9_ASPNC|nr:hypothetical protein An15g05430 [Aspergillus niger]CAK97328.1 hypothetical protein An15g05430 [Aspergillus niger]